MAVSVGAIMASGLALHLGKLWNRGSIVIGVHPGSVGNETEDWASASYLLHKSYTCLLCIHR